MQKILIITGGSKGIGEGIILAYQQEGFCIFSIARTKNIKPNFNNITQIEFDLSNTDEIALLLTKIFNSFTTNEIQEITLINNAGTLGEINTTENLNPSDIAKTVLLNTTAPLILSATFLKLSHSITCQKTIINISSGAATKPYSGWTVYCATKAALDMMTQTIALEQQHVENGAKIIAIYPGVVDTEMQSKIRASTKENFAAIDRFLELKSTNSLANAETVGQKIFAVASDHSIENGTILRIEA